MNVGWIPLLATALSIVGAAGTYAYQKRVDRKTALVHIRRDAYRSYLNAFMAMSDSPERVEEIRRQLYQAEIELLVVGSDAVIQRIGALSKFYADTNHDRFNRDSSEIRRLVADVCRSMRADCFETSHLTTEEIRVLVPIA